MDGVLFDTEKVCMDAWVAVAEKRGMALMEEVFPRCIGLNANDSRQIVLEAYGEDFDYPGFRQETADWFRDYIEREGLPVKPGAGQLLEWLKSTDYRVGLASSTRRSSVLSHLRQAGFNDYFSAVITGDMVEHSKPLPDIYLLACEELGVRPEETYAIEDSPNGIRAAHAAGMHAIMVPDMIQPDGEMRRLSDEIFENLGEVLHYLASEYQDIKDQEELPVMKSSTL